MERTPTYATYDEFQSHHGLISTYYVQSDTEPTQCKYWFQSHHGLISTVSTMKDETVKSIDFNPTMVWFLHEHGRRDPSGTLLFQSHHGLISTLLVALYEPDPENGCDFNPTMVWFLQIFGDGFHFEGEGFQSHHGLISTTDFT